MTRTGEERLNVYDAEARVVGARERRAAKASGMAVGAINVLVVNAGSEVLLQRRHEGVENGGRWDKSVGGHVSAGESFDAAAVREASEELFDRDRSERVRLAEDPAGFAGLLAGADLAREVVLRRVALHRNLRDVRHAPEGGVRNVLYHVAIYLGRSDLELAGFSPQAAEIADLRWFAPGRVDEMLLRGELAPNMAFLWLAHGQELLSLAAPRAAK